MTFDIKSGDVAAIEFEPGRQMPSRRALATLGLAWEQDVLNYRQRLRGEKQVTSPTYEAVAQPIYTRAVGRWRNYQRLLEPVCDALGPFIRQFGYDI